MKIDIIGAGIGGLTTAIALQKKGVKVRLFEQATTIKPLGAGIILAHNAMQVYEKLGLRKIIEENGTIVCSMNITNEKLNPFSKVNMKYFDEKYGVKTIAIHRGKLQQILIKALNFNQIYTAHKLNYIGKNSKGYVLNFENDKSYSSKIIVGADGINSTVRKIIFTDKGIRKAKQICWRGVANYALPKNFENELNEVWGETERFGFVQISANEVYWYAVKKNSAKLSSSKIQTYFEKHHNITRGIIDSTALAHIHSSEMADLRPIISWHKENICLIGDAAHAATPNMGQGACQAIEDAYTLTACLDKYNTREAFIKFQKTRLAKTKRIVDTSWKLGKVSHVSNPIAILIRNLLLKNTPAFITKKQSDKIYKLTHI